MGDSIGKVFWVAAEGEGSGFGVVYEHRHRDLRERSERGARAVALHVLELACPSSPILAAMRQGMSFEEAVERFDVRSQATVPLERTYRSALELISDGAQDPAKIAKAALARRGQELRFTEAERAGKAKEFLAMLDAAERIDEPTEAEFAAAVGEIFAGIADPMARSGS